MYPFFGPAESIAVFYDVKIGFTYVCFVCALYGTVGTPTKEKNYRTMHIRTAPYGTGIVR